MPEPAGHDADANVGAPPSQISERLPYPEPRGLDLEREMQKTLAKRATFESDISSHETPTVTPAVEALRRLSGSTKSDEQPGTLRRLSMAIAASFKLNKTSHGSDEDQASTTLVASNDARGSAQAPSPAITRWQTVTYGYGANSRPQPVAMGLPSKIYVRKASAARRPTLGNTVDPRDIAEPSGHVPEPIQIAPPAVELVAFYAEHRQQYRQSSPAARTYSVSVPKSRKGSIAMPTFTNTERRKSEAAGVAITYADVHIAPGTFVSSPSRTMTWQNPEVFVQRVSAVQLRASNSVHEIIWREDETLSSSSISPSSHGSSSPHQATQFITIGADSSGDGSPISASRASIGRAKPPPFLQSQENTEESVHRLGAARRGSVALLNDATGMPGKAGVLDEKRPLMTLSERGEVSKEQMGKLKVLKSRRMSRSDEGSHGAEHSNPMNVRQLVLHGRPLPARNGDP